MLRETKTEVKKNFYNLKSNLTQRTTMTVGDRVTGADCIRCRWQGIFFQNFAAEDTNNTASIPRLPGLPMSGCITMLDQYRCGA